MPQTPFPTADSTVAATGSSGGPRDTVASIHSSGALPAAALPAREVASQEVAPSQDTSPSALLTRETFTPSLTHEPQYSGEPGYFVAVLEDGQQIWGVFDRTNGETDQVVYLDLNGNGDLIDEGERLTLQPFRVLGGRGSAGDNLAVRTEVELPGDDAPLQLSVFVEASSRGSGDGGFGAQGLRLSFQQNSRTWVVVRRGDTYWYTYHLNAANPTPPGPTPEEALVFHLGGPMAFRTSRQFRAEADGDTELYAELVTLPCPISNTYARVGYNYLPADVIPSGRVRYETRSGEQVTRDIELPRRC